MEKPAADFFEARKFRFGADVFTSESERGALAHVQVDADSGTLQSAGVRFGIFGRVVYVTAEHITEASSDTIRLNITRDALQAEGLQPAGTRLGSDTVVTLDGQRVGKLAQATFDANTRRLRRLVVARGFGGEEVASASAIAKVEAGVISLSKGASGAQAVFTPYRPDEDLRQDIHRAIEDYGRMRVDLSGIDIPTVDGAVWLRGHVSSDLNRRLVEDLASGVVGVAELHNELISDQELASAIASALSRDPRTSEERIGVYPSLGRAHLRGAVRTAAAREAAAQIAAAGHGAREVINELRIDPNATVIPVLAGVTGNEDMVPGGR